MAKKVVKPIIFMTGFSGTGQSSVGGEAAELPLMRAKVQLERTETLS